MKLRQSFGVEPVNGPPAGENAAYAGGMTAAPSHLASIRELRDIRRERPRMSGETADHYFQRVAVELRRRQQAQRPANLVARILRRSGRA